jgi:outer membrane murein-binding lipoprotein Lpp
MLSIKKVFLLILVAATVLVSGCANRPESISASYMSHERFIDNDCAKLATQMGDARADLQKFSDMQNSQANTDAATVFFVLIPASQLAGDYEADVAKYKGMVEAIETAQIKNKCK